MGLVARTCFVDTERYGFVIRAVVDLLAKLLFSVSAALNHSACNPAHAIATTGISFKPQQRCEF